MSKTRFVVDVGDYSTKIYREGLILKKPSAVLVRREGYLRLIASGEDVYNAVDKHSDPVNPIVDGAVFNVEAAQLMLRSFLDIAIGKNLFSKPQIIVPISSGLTMVEREAYEESFIRAGYKNVWLVESIMGFIPFVDARGQAVIEFREGSIELGVLGEEGIIAACSANMGEKRLDRMINEFILDNFNATVGHKATEKIRKETLSLYTNDLSSSEVIATDVLDGKKRIIEVSSKGLMEVTVSYFKRVIDILESLITTVPQGVGERIKKNGVLLAGGLGETRGLAEYLQKNSTFRTLANQSDIEFFNLRGF